MTTRSVIVAAVRTPFGRLGGGLAARSATELGAIAIRAALERTGIEAHEPQYAIIGQVLQGGAGQAPARQAAVGAGLPNETPADTINKVCASSIRAVEIADSMIRAGDVEVVVEGERTARQCLQREDDDEEALSRRVVVTARVGHELGADPGGPVDRRRVAVERVQVDGVVHVPRKASDDVGAGIVRKR